ncbi:MAG: hypothetical protein FWG92_07780, partial [Leptospirales bacterium]|nr:hypothetical protein [Leptospirales bacterium]
IAPASTVISLGGRFQYFKTVFDEAIDVGSIPAASEATYNSNAKNKFYGVTLTATYTFSF